MKTSQGQRVFSATLLKKVPEVVEAGLRDIDRTPNIEAGKLNMFILQRKLPTHIHRQGDIDLPHLVEKDHAAQVSRSAST